MRRFFLLVFILSASLSCNVQRVNPIATSQNIPEPSSNMVNESLPEQSPSREVLEKYSNETRVGRRHQNKVEIDIVNNGEWRGYHPTNLAIIRFYSRTPARKWKLTQTLQIEDDAVAEAYPKFKDFNNDGLNDITFISGSPARGANEVRTLLIYDKSADRLVHIRNSAQYPNIRFNRTLNCIDAFLVYGGTQTVFLKLHGDMLKKFASVENFDDRRTVTVIDGNGKEKIIKEQAIVGDQLYDRFENFSPLILFREK